MMIAARIASNWDALTDIQSLQCIEYLIQNYKNYAIKISGEDVVLGDDIKISRLTKVDAYKLVYDYAINGRLFDFPFDRTLAEKLYNMCQKFVKSQTKQNQK